MRAGKSFYNFFSENMKLPHIRTVQNFMHKDLPPLLPNCFDFDGLKKFIFDRNLSTSVSLSGDAAKIVENVRYDSKTNTIVGLTSPFDEMTGIPQKDFHKADSAEHIYNSIMTYPKASMVECVIARPNTTNAPCFLLGYFYTDLSYTHEDKKHRIEYCYNELEKRELKMICEVTDGESISIASQKRFMRFGECFLAFGLTLAVDYTSKIVSGQDPEHDMKKMKNTFYSNVLRVGEKNASIAHLEILLKDFPKSQHGLTKTDLNVEDRMDYRFD